MKRATFVGMAAMVWLAAGCAQSPEPYLEAFTEQRSAWKEMAAILATIEDETTMAAAKTKLDERSGRFEQIARKAKALPKPSDDVKERLEQERFSMQRAAENLQSEVARVRRLNLKGTAEFFNQFESYQSLLQAVRP